VAAHVQTTPTGQETCIDPALHGIPAAFHPEVIFDRFISIWNRHANTTPIVPLTNIEMTRSGARLALGLICSCAILYGERLQPKSSAIQSQKISKPGGGKQHLSQVPSPADTGRGISAGRPDMMVAQIFPRWAKLGAVRASSRPS